MAYYTRIMTPSESIPDFKKMSDLLKADFPQAALSLEKGTETAWEQALVSFSSGEEIVLIERDRVEEGSLATDELDAFMEEISGCSPASAADWLNEYLQGVKTVIAFQYLSGSEKDDGWEILDRIKGIIWEEVGGVLQADDQGFTNEDGYHILWQFPDDATGPWWMGVIQNDSWVYFEMDLGNAEQRNDFQRGVVPPGVKFAE
jgi:hypothetical protein